MIKTKESPESNSKKPKKQIDEPIELLDKNDPILKAWMSVREILKEIGSPKTGKTKRLKPNKQARQ